MDKEMSQAPSAKVPNKSFVLRFLVGLLIGVGAILPGISGGVLMVVFGIYQPMMETLAHPIAGAKRYWKLFLPVALGWAVGFFVLAGVMAIFLEKEAAVITSLFVGLILGTLPGLFQSGAELEPQKPEWTALAISTAVLFAFFFTVKFALVETSVTPNFFWYIFCGALWGVSLVAPGMTSSSLLILLGLLQPLSEGLSRFDFGVIAPFIIGILAALAAFAKFVNYLIKHHYSVFYYCIIGFVIASTLPIIPLKFASALEAVLSVAALIVGVIASLAMEKFSKNGKEKERACTEEAEQG